MAVTGPRNGTCSSPYESLVLAFVVEVRPMALIRHPSLNRPGRLLVRSLRPREQSYRTEAKRKRKVTPISFSSGLSFGRRKRGQEGREGKGARKGPRMRDATEDEEPYHDLFTSLLDELFVLAFLEQLPGEKMSVQPVKRTCRLCKMLSLIL